jgi:hypothetical protein
MVRNRRLAWAVVLWALVSAVPVAAADSPLSQVPAETPVVFHVRGFERAKGRLLTMIKNALPDVAPKVQSAIDDGIKQVLEGRELKGLSKDGSIFVAVFDLAAPFPDKGGEVAGIVQVTSYADFRDSLLKGDERKALRKEPAGYEQARINERELYFIDRKEYAVLTPSKALAVRLAKKEAGLDSTLPKDLAGRLLDADAAIYLNMATLNKSYDLKQFRQQFEEAIGHGANQGGAAKSTLKMMQAIADPFFQAVADSQAVVASYEFHPEGLKLRADVSVGQGSKTNSLLKDFQVDAFAELSKLPRDRLGYVGAAVDSKVFKDLMPILVGIMDDPKSPEGKAYKQALEALMEAKPRRLVEGFRLPANGIAIWDCEYPDKAATAHLQLLKNIKAGSPYMAGFVKGEPKIEADAQTYRDFKLHSASVIWDVDKLVNETATASPRTEAQKEQFKAAMKKVLGESAHYWFGSNGKSFVLLMGDNWEAARKLLDTVVDGKETIGDVESFQEARRHLPAKATVVELIDAPLYAEMMLGFMQASLAPGGKLPPRVQEYKASAGKHSFLGIAASFREQRASFELWIPGTAVSQLRTVFEPLFKDLKDLNDLGKEEPLSRP